MEFVTSVKEWLNLAKLDIPVVKDENDTGRVYRVLKVNSDDTYPIAVWNYGMSPDLSSYLQGVGSRSSAVSLQLTRRFSNI